MRNLRVEKEIEVAKKIIFNNKQYSQGYKKYHVVPFKGTENIKELFSQLQSAFQVLLMVTGSGDQVLEAVLHGAKDITCFDINILAKYGCQLKIAAVKALSYEEFITFYTRGFSLELFKKVSYCLEEDSFYFWGSLFETIDHYVIHTSLFDTKDHSRFGLMDTNFSIYSKEDYEEIKNNLKNATIHYMDENLLTLPKKLNSLNKKFDLAYFSNIFYYLGKNEKFYAKFLLQKICPFIKKSGEILFHYLYGAGGKIQSSSFQDILWINYNLEIIECLEKYISLTKYRVSNSGYGNPLGDKDVALSLKR